MALYFMIFAVGQMLKLISFHHVMYDNRDLVFRAKQVKGSPTTEQLSSLFNVNVKSMELALEYPKNFKIAHYVRFLCAPTCCYQLSYPLTEGISKLFVFKRLMELTIGNIFVSYLVY
jgi:diacylglycerol O-acyltransferase-1